MLTRARRPASPDLDRSHSGSAGTAAQVVTTYAYMVLPRRPDGAVGTDEAALAGLVSRNGLIGTAAV
jgi:hypothetical protein